MSTLPENEFDLEKLFLPAWAQEPASAKSYENYQGEEARPERREGRRGPRPPRREGGPPQRREGGFGERREGFRPRREGAGPGGAEGRPNRPGRRFGEGDRDRGARDFRERREPPVPLPELNVALLPDPKGVESLARQIRMTGRAYPLFEIAQMILQKPERHVAAFSVKKNAEGQPVQPLFLCALDDTLWLSEAEAVAHVLRKHFATFYQAERTATEPPKGKYTFVAQCGMSGVILGPPNHHDYQNQLRKLHSDRFSRMPFEVYKSRVRIVRDEEVVKKWVEDQSWKTDYICLNMPEPLRLGSMEAVEAHFRETHKEVIIKPVESHTLSGTAARSQGSPQLGRLVRSVWEDQRRFPLQIATALSQQFASQGLHFFKVNRTVTHVAVARPHYLDLEATPVSEGVKRIVEYINSHPKCTRRHLQEALAPAPPAPAVIPIAPEAAPAEQSAAPAPAPAPALEPPQPTPEQTAVIADLHWLVHQGHVIEFANGTLETAKKPVPKPPKPAPKAPEAAPAEQAAAPGSETQPPTAIPASEAEAQPPSPSSAEPLASDVAPPPPAEATPQTDAQPGPTEPGAEPPSSSEPLAADLCPPLPAPATQQPEPPPALAEPPAPPEAAIGAPPAAPSQT